MLSRQQWIPLLEECQWRQVLKSLEKKMNEALVLGDMTITQTYQCILTICVVSWPPQHFEL